MKKKQILIVEDERVVAEHIKMSLLRLGYAVPAIVFCGEEAIRKAEEIHPDLVLMDVVLEGEMDGIEVARIIRSRFDIPVLYLTAYADDKILERAKITEPFGYILKPFEDRELRTTIEVALYKHKMENMLKESEERYRSVVENAHDAIYITTQDGFQYANPAFERLISWKNEDLCKKEFNFWKIIHPDDIKLIKGKEKTGIRKGKVPSSYEFRIISNNGGVKIVEANTVNIGKNGEVKKIGILRDITERRRAEQELKKSFKRLQSSFEQTIKALASSLEMKDPYTAGHQQRVTNLACAIAKEMSLSKEQIDGIHMAGAIHDIGKISVPAEILSKPDRLNEGEMLLIKNHPQIGYDILKEIEFPWPVAKIILQHHERMDGSGYPAGLSGEDILLEARILAVADIVEAMCSHRPYRPALGINKALEEISQNRGILCDSMAVDACLKLFYEKEYKFEQEYESRNFT